MADNTHETKVVIKGDDSSVLAALSRVKTALQGGVIGTLNKVRNVVGLVMNSLGTFGMAVQGVNALIEGFKKLNEWMHRAETAAKALREELAKRSYENAVAHAAEAYKNLNKNLEETLRLEKERSKILSDRKTTERDIEDADAERKKQLEISRLDPNAENYKDRKNEIERRYSIAASDTRAARAREDAQSDAKSLYDQAASKDREADELGKVLKTFDRIASTAVERSWKATMDARGGDEDAKKKAEEAAREERKAVLDAKKIREQMEAARREAESLRRLAAEKAGGNFAANIRNEAEKLAIENNAKAEAAEKEKVRKKEAAEKEKVRKKEAAEKEKEQKTRDQNLEDARLERQKQEDLAALNPTDPDYKSKKREIEYTYEAKAAENKIARAENETDRRTAEEEFNAFNIRHNSEKRNETIEQAMEVAERTASFDGVSQNRLTAMGLGSGVSASGGIASDVKKLVDLLKAEVDESKKANARTDESSAATYSE